MPGQARFSLSFVVPYLTTNALADGSINTAVVLFSLLAMQL